MKHSTHLARSATSAIAAALVLVSTPLFAQDADPAAATVAPEITPPVASAPVTIAPSVVAPAPAAPTVVSNPVVQQVHYPVVTAPAAEPSAAPVATRQPPAARAAPVVKTVTRTATTQMTTQAAPPSAANDVAPASDAADVLPPAPVVADQAPPVTEPAQSAAATQSNQWLNLIVLGGLMLLVLAILGLIYRRFARRNRTVRAAAPKAMRPQASAPRPAPAVAPVAAPVSTPVAPAAPPEIAAVTAAPVRADRPVEPARTEPTPIRRQTVSFAAAGRTPGALPSAGASVDLPARIPEDYDERSALLKRMVEAKPDKANPFRNRKSRTKRARLIIQSLGRKFEHTDPWIDLSQYPNNWPELARRYSQAA